MKLGILKIKLEKPAKQLLMANALLCFTFFIFGPLELYLSNTGEFWFPFYSLFPVVFVCFIFSWCILSAVGIFLPENWKKWFAALIFGFGVAIYLQGNFMQQDYAILDGKTHGIYGWEINLVLWGVILLAPFFVLKYKSKFFYRIVKWISIYLLAIQLVTLGVAVAGAGQLSGTAAGQYFSSQSMFQVSSKKNIIIFVLDTFDSGYFDAVLRDEPEYKNMFQGFTYFDNAVAGGAPTILGVPTLLTGEIYNTEVPYEKFWRNAFQKDTLFRGLRQNGYDVRFLTDYRYTDGISKDQADNLEVAQPEIVSYQKFARLLYKFTGYRYAPAVLKPYFWIYSEEFDDLMERKNEDSENGMTYRTDDAAFYTQLKTEGIRITDQKNIYRFFHLRGMHAPYTLTADAETSNSPTSAREQAKGVLKIVKEYLSQLQEAGFYDNTTVIVTADHGAVDLYQNPILLIKPSRSQKEFTVSHAPVSLSDLNATVEAAAMGGSVDTEKNLFSYKEGEQRKRAHVVHHELAQQAFPEYSYSEDFVAYVVEGDARDISRIRRTTGQDTMSKTYLMDKLEVDFSAEGDCAEFLGKGWNGQEAVRRWSSTEAEFVFVSTSENDILLTLYGSAYGASGDGRVLLNGHEVAVFRNDEIRKANQVEILLPKRFLNPKRQIVTFEMPDAVSPKEAGKGTDGRTLGLSVQKIIVEKKY